MSKKRIAYIVTERPGRKPEWTRAGRGKIHDDGTEELYMIVNITDPRSQKIVIRDWREVLD